MSMNSMQYAACSRQRAPVDVGPRIARRSLPTACRLPPTMRSGFSLVELLIVIGIIVLVMALAVPALNLITGTRSVDAAENLVSVMLGRARTEAIGVQQIRGLLFYLDPATQRVNMTLVQSADPPNTGALDVDVYLDITSVGDTLMLPNGVGLQVVDDVVMTGSSPNLVRSDDAFIGYNNINANPAAGAGAKTAIAYGGVILFDSRGQLISRTFALKARTGVIATPYTEMGKLLFQPTESNLSTPDTAHMDVLPVLDLTSLKTQRSQVGLILFDETAFRASDDRNNGDPQIDTTLSPYSPRELEEETWLDNNAVPLLINRYNGTLVKGE